MKSSVIGKSILKVEVANISAHGIWVIAGEREYFLSYSDYPWFKKAAIGGIFDVKLLHDYHLYWPTLEIDIDIRSLEAVEQYPLVYK